MNCAVICQSETFHEHCFTRMLENFQCLRLLMQTLFRAGVCLGQDFQCEFTHKPGERGFRQDQT